MFRTLSLAACLACAAACSSARAPDHEAPKLRLIPQTGVAAPFSLTASDGTGLVLREMRAQVVVESALAFTQLELAFQNPEPRRIEGRLQLLLPEGASISRLALQIGERYQEGEVVAQPQAVEAYEEALHGRRDPALLEREAGNQYRMRIFPIEAHETKRVIVAYSQLLVGSEEGYRLPLAGLAKLERVRAEVHWLEADLSVRQLFERRAWQPTGDLALALPTPNSALAHDGLVLVPMRAPAAHERADFSRLTVLFDTSASGALQLEQRIARLGKLLTALGAAKGAPFPVLVVPFDQTLGVPLELRSDELDPALRTQLQARGALGATDLEAALLGLRTLPQLGERVLVYSDGVATAGATQAAKLCVSVAALRARGVRRLDAITPGQLHDRSLLAALVHGDLPEAGVVVPDETPASAAQHMLRAVQRRMTPRVQGALWTYPAELLGVEPGKVYPLFARFGGPVPKQLRVDGQVELPVHEAKASSAALLARAWAQAQIGYLEQKRAGLVTTDAEKVRQRIIELSTREQVVSDQTSWVVLETDEDYQRHAIERRSAHVLAVQRGSLTRVVGGPRVDDWLLEEPWLRVGQEIASAEAGALGTEPLKAASANVPAVGSPAGSDQPAEAKTSGILGVLASSRGNFAAAPRFGASAYGADTALGYDPTSMLGALMGHSGTGVRHAERARLVPSVRLGPSDVRGSLSREHIRRVIQRHLNELRFCYDQELQRHTRLHGTLAVKFIVAPSGSVQIARVQASTLGHARLEGCFVAAVNRWTFPAPDAGGIVVAHQNFVLSGPSLATSESSTVVSQWQREAKRQEQIARRALLEQRGIDWAERAQPAAADALEGPLLEITELIGKGAHAHALTRARILHQAAPHDMMILLALARAAAAHGEQELAARAYGSLIDLFPGRAEFRRAAGQGLESLGDAGLALAIDSYRKAVAQRPDHPSGHRLLAMALWRAGERSRAHEALKQAQTKHWPFNRFPGVANVLSDDLELSEGKAPRRALRLCLYWENDSTDVDLLLYDGLHRQVGLRPAETPGPSASADVATGFGPECISADDDEIAYPYRFQAHYAARGAMGHALGALHILRTDAAGHASFEMRPFVLMKEQAYLELGELVAEP